MAQDVHQGTPADMRPKDDTALGPAAVPESRWSVPALLSNEKRIIIAFRSLVVLTAIAAFFNLAPGAPVPWQFYFSIAIFVLSNVVFLLEKRQVFDHHRAQMLVLTFDVAMVSFLFLLLGLSSREFYLVFFLTIFVSALSRRASYAFAISTVMAGLYLVFTIHGKTDVAVASWPFFIRVVLFFIVSTFVGHLSEVSEARGKGLAETQRIAHLGNWHRDIRTNKLWWSDEVYRIFGIAQQGGGVTYDAFLEAVHPEDRDALQKAAGAALEGAPYGLVHRVVRPDGEVRWVREQGAVTFDESDQPVRMVGTVLDITDYKQAEEGLRRSEELRLQSQRLEAVGRLAGGIAHDFKNMLSVIIGYSDLLLLNVEKDGPLAEDVGHIIDAAQRSNSLTTQLLAFSRKQVLLPKVLDVNAVIRELEGLFRRVIGEDIRFRGVYANDLGNVKADPAQLEQVLMNLVVNARDAMPHGGELTIETGNVELDEAYVRTHVGAQIGPHVMLAVKDTGVGMDEETCGHIFEPFFTSKEESKGTGLGLSTAYGIVKQSGGDIWVYSEPGKGTTFKIYLPRVDEALDEVVARRPSAGQTGGTETVLVVEDEGEVRGLVCRALRTGGYTVIEAPDGVQALEACGQHEGGIDLVISDVVMPHMGGPALAEELRQIYPGIRVLFSSGYGTDSVQYEQELISGTAFLEKPYTVSSLLAVVRSILDD